MKDKSDDDFISYDLKVIRTIQESKIYKPTPDGEVFNFCERRDSLGCVGKLIK